MTRLNATLAISLISVGLFGATAAMAGGASTSVRAALPVIAPQVTRELATQTGKQVSDAAAEAIRQTQKR